MDRLYYFRGETTLNADPKSNWVCRYCQEKRLQGQYYEGVLGCLAMDDSTGLRQLVGEMDSYEFSYVWKLLHNRQKAKFKELQTKAAGYSMEETCVSVTTKK